MKVSHDISFLIILLIALSVAIGINAAPKSLTCLLHKSPCFLKKIRCPYECPSASPSHPKAKVCYINCDSPICKAECRNKIISIRNHKPNCNSPGAACLGPRFIVGDGIVFYFHGKRDEHFILVSDLNLQINARFTGLRPACRSRDYTWIQALGFLFDSNAFSLRATRSATWNDEVDHLKFTCNGKEIVIPEGHLLSWGSQEGNLRVERTSNKNSVLVTLPEVAEISVNVVPVTKEDDRVHNYQTPSDYLFAHLEIQFRFSGLSSKVEGVLGRTYQSNFQNPANPGVAMPVVEGEGKYRTASLLSSNCNSCIFSPAGAFDQKHKLMDYGTLDCSGSATSGNGIVCRK